jgi:hypothetical protein
LEFKITIHFYSIPFKVPPVNTLLASWKKFGGKQGRGDSSVMDDPKKPNYSSENKNIP